MGCAKLETVAADTPTALSILVVLKWRITRHRYKSMRQDTWGDLCVLICPEEESPTRSSREDSSFQPSDRWGHRFTGSLLEHSKVELSNCSSLIYSRQVETVEMKIAGKRQLRDFK